MDVGGGDDAVAAVEADDEAVNAACRRMRVRAWETLLSGLNHDDRGFHPIVET